MLPSWMRRFPLPLAGWVQRTLPGAKEDVVVTPEVGRPHDLVQDRKPLVEAVKDLLTTWDTIPIPAANPKET